MATLTALVADDSLSARQQLGEALAKAGFAVTETKDGNDALKLATSQPFDLILVDIYLPKLDGISLIKKLRQQPEYQTTPMLAVSTNQASAKKDAIREVGASGLIRLPIQADEFQAMLKKLLPN